MKTLFFFSYSKIKAYIYVYFTYDVYSQDMVIVSMLFYMCDNILKYALFHPNIIVESNRFNTFCNIYWHCLNKAQLDFLCQVDIVNYWVP